MTSMGEFEKDCPVCGKRFTSLIEYTEHLGNVHSDIPPDKISEIKKEHKWTLGG